MRIAEVSGVSRRAGVAAGEELLSINGRPVSDILDILYLSYETDLRLELRAPGGDARFVPLRHSAGGDIGLTFENDLPDGGRVCANNCVFCFTDQNPPGCRESLYYKDDDARLSFLQGNYISLTNLGRRDIERICEMKFGPLGISVHTTDPALREKMLRNKRAGECLSLMRRFAASGVRMNAQIVLCPGLNDGDNLYRTLYDLQTLGGMLLSTSIVPVGLTKHRAGLPYISPVTREDALAAVAAAEDFLNVWCSDEMLLLAGLPVPPAEYYMDFPQLENGVGMLSLFLDEWAACGGGDTVRPPVTVATGLAAAPMLTDLLGPIVVPVENRFFGKTVGAAGLLTGSDLLRGLRGRDLGEKVLIPSSALRRGEDVFLDGMTVGELSEGLGVPVEPAEPDAESLRRALG